jgi:hypothetical protein
MRRLALAALLLGAFAGAGCRGDGEKVADARKTLASWESTVRLAAAQRQANALPKPFFRDVLRAAREGVEKEERRLDRLAAKGAEEASPLAGQARALLGEIDALRASVP